MGLASNLRGFHHLGLPVLDIEASKKWYSEYLGFELVYETRFREGTGETKVAFLNLNGFVIEMYESEDSLAAIKSRGHGHIDHIAFDVDDIEEVHKKLKMAGIKTIEANPKYLPIWPKGIRFLIVLGPNNEKIEFNQKIG